MPPRWFSFAIILFWLTVTGFMFWRDLLPRLLPGQPPPYTIELVEEAQVNRPAVNWVVTKDDKVVAVARTRIDHPPHEDVFNLIAEITPKKPGEPFTVNGIRVNSLKSIYRVNAAGDLLGLSVSVEGRVDPNHPQVQILERLLGRQLPDLVLDIDGDVKDGEMTPHLQGKLRDFPGKKKLTYSLPTVSVPHGGAVLLPLHPVNRLRGLKLGQSWTMRVLDPLAESLGTILGKDDETRILHARVRPQVEPLPGSRHKGTPCLVIDYAGDDMHPLTWVALDSGLVMRQEATLDKNRWAMYRE